MRKALAKEEGHRKKFVATFSRLGKKVGYHGYAEETILLTMITDRLTNNLLTEHLWFTFSKGFQNAGMKPGDKIEFEARIKKYSKGYVNVRYAINEKKVDFKLGNPTKIKVIEAAPNELNK